ncbi:MAG: Methyltransferase type 11 [Modestobacter sp.]|nr:Methyltransferase type 11 [Modestobacter sp.]
MQAQDWDARYAEKPQWSAAPNAVIASLLGGLPPGRAVDLAAGEGRHALWLAGRGWEVTAVDFSAAGLERGRAAPGADEVGWVVADVLTWEPGAAGLDLVLVAYLHLPEADTVDLLTRAVGWLSPGGRLVVLGHDVQNLTRGVGGPQEAAILHSVDRLAPVAALLAVDRLEQVSRTTPAGTAIDTLLVGRRPAEPSPAPAPR